MAIFNLPPSSIYYAEIWGFDGQRWSGTAMVAPSSIASTDWAAGMIALVELSTSDSSHLGVYTFTAPSALPAGGYLLTVHSTNSFESVVNAVAISEFTWNGSAEAKSSREVVEAAAVNVAKIGGTAQSAGRDLGTVLPNVPAGAYGGLPTNRTKYAIGSKSWADTSAWADGVLPVAGDDIVLTPGSVISIVTGGIDFGVFGSLCRQGDCHLIVGVSVASIPRGWVVDEVDEANISVNSGTIRISDCTIDSNYGTVEYYVAGTMGNNSGSVIFNSGNITNNMFWGRVVCNGTGSTIGTNYGIVEYNFGTITTNSGIVLHNLGAITNDNGLSNTTALESEKAIAAKFAFVGNRVKAIPPPQGPSQGSPSAFMFTLTAKTTIGKIISSASNVSTQTTIGDRVKTTTTHTSAVVGTQWQITYDRVCRDEQSDAFGDPPITYTSSNTAVATVDASGFVSYVDNGTAIITGTSAATETSPAWSAHVTITNSTSSESPYDVVTYSDVSGSARAEADSSIDNLLTSGATTSIFSAERPYTYSETCWAKAIDLTSCLVYNSYQRSYLGAVLISPRHALGCGHAVFPVGTTFDFVGSDGTVHTRTVTASQQLGDQSTLPDFTVYLLDSDVSGVSFAKILPADYATHLPNKAADLLCFGINQYQQALVRAIASIDGGQVACEAPATATELEFYGAIINHDSGHPFFMLLGNTPVLLGVWTSGGYGAGSFVTAYQSQIEAAMVALGGGYTTMVTVDLSGFNSY